MATARRFVFFEDMKSGGQRLMLANLDERWVRFAPTAHIIAQMGTVPGELPTEGVPETYQTIACRPDNAYAAVWSAQVGLDFVDWNIGIYDMETGAQAVRFNEHSVSGVNRANCASAVFNAFLASEAAAGVPQAQIDAYDYRVIVEGTGPGEPTLAWSTTGTLIATFALDVEIVGSGFGVIGRDSFAFEVSVTPSAGGTVQILSRNAGIAPALVPRNPFSVRSLATRLLPGGPPVIHYGKSPVSFWPWPWKWLPRWLGGLVTSAYRKALAVQGFIH